MIPVSITHLNHFNMATSCLRVRGLAMQILGKLNTMRTLSSEHGIELGFFFTGAESHNPHVEIEFPTVVLYRFFKKILIIGHNAPFVSLKSCSSQQHV